MLVVGLFGWVIYFCSARGGVVEEVEEEGVINVYYLIFFLIFRFFLIDFILCRNILYFK
jgi:hypothetical protein